MSKQFTLPFGKHKGKTLDKVPLLYLDWMLTLELYPETRKVIQDYLSDPVIEQELDRQIAKKELQGG